MRSEGWAWDCINYELWFNAVQQPSPGYHHRRGLPFSTGVRVTVPVETVGPSIRDVVCGVPAPSDISAGGVVVPTPVSVAPSPTSVNLPLSNVSYPNRSHAIPKPVSPTALKGVLVGYDGLKSQYLVNGFRSGFASRFNISRYRISPLGVVPKKLPGEFRVIHNLSYPEGESVNDYIPQEFSTVQYATTQNSISFIKEADSVVFMAKVDIEAAFRIIPISPQVSPLLGFKWRGSYYMDAVLPMGCSSSCSIFEAFSTALEWIAMNKLGITKVVHIIDDFLFLAPSHAKCLHDMKAFMRLCEQLGVPLAPDKTVGPTTALQFLGITLDTVSMEARFTDDS